MGWLDHLLRCHQQPRAHPTNAIITEITNNACIKGDAFQGVSYMNDKVRISVFYLPVILLYLEQFLLTCM